MVKALPIDDRIILQSAKATVTNLIDGIVELITNSDDSYGKLEQREEHVTGRIEIYVNRKKGGICEKLVIKDSAEGMAHEKLIGALRFGGKTSGFGGNISGRGLWGRGLKETIVSLGEGDIKTVNKGRLCKTKVWIDEINERACYDDELLNKVEVVKERNGTEVIINIKNEKIKIPEIERFIEQVSKHYALRDINNSKNRNIELTFEELTSRFKQHGPTTDKRQITFSPPQGNKVEEKIEKLIDYGDKIKITIYESSIPLDSPRHNPFGLAGLLIKTKKAILDNQLFKFDTDPAGLYFFGEVMCYGLEERIREKKQTELLDFNRGGLNWKKDYCQVIEKIVEKILEPHILRKKGELQQNKPASKINESAKKMFHKLSNLLNQIAKAELGEETDRPPEPPPDVFDLTIIPNIANVQKDKPRTLLIMAPFNLVKQEGKKINIESNNEYIYPLSWSFDLEKSNKYPETIWSRYFKVATRSQEGETTITIRLGSKSVSARIKVAPPRIIGPRQKRKGGFITDFDVDNGSRTGIQRVFYDTESGMVYINIRFPSIANYIKDGLEGADTPEGRMLLTELVGEVFFRRLAYESIERSGYIPGEGQIDDYNLKINELQKKYLYKIQETIFLWKF